MTGKFAYVCPFCLDSEGFSIELDDDGICDSCGYDEYGGNKHE